ncbi:MAG TPA: hypothetical protein VMC09_06555 [Anaerolineales bacterium]|nr:hypothetical protein [Anaerolineales bacterium]
MVKRKIIPFVLVAMFIMACSCGSLSSLIPKQATPSAVIPQTGGSDTQTAPTSGPDPSFPQASQFGGTWAGNWKNTTYGTTGKISATITVQPDGTLTADVTLGGNILGIGSPSPLTFDGTYDATGLSFGGPGEPIFGDLAVTVDYAGKLAMEASNLPVPGIAKVSAAGTMTATELKVTYTVTFSTGATAKGTATLKKTS